MLKELIEQGYGEQQDFNCAEKILYGANEAYQLGLEKNALRLSAGFGGGMGIGSVCGVLTASVMVLSCLFVSDKAHESDQIKKMTQELFQNYRQEMGEIDCRPLQTRYRTKEIKCRAVIVKAAEILDCMIAREWSSNRERYQNE
jgi:C_GCAxxG_C_C family probable redox protein